MTTMPTHNYNFLYLGLIISLITITSPASAQLSVSFYDTTCPSVFNTVRFVVRSAINREARMGASLIRLFFHDCFVNGCDGGILLDDTGSFVGEKTAGPNANSVRGFDVIDRIKAQVDKACGSPVVSCADIVAIAARDSVVALGGPSYSVPVGRRDATTASKSTANTDLPSPFEDLSSIAQKFTNKGFTFRDMVALSGAHTVGFAQCRTFRTRLYNESNIEPNLATSLKTKCASTAGSTDSNLAPLDSQSPNRFGNNYYQGLINNKGLLHSDQVLFNGGQADSIVKIYSDDADTFNTDFASAMVKMGNLSPLTGTAGQVRVDCKKVN
ncbi:cationic peroxidase 1-like [Dioscorea cayenensis subsp. rotundata]|uniref:Peroxidase n=1 Tax=Dioscorea cayennensis subsp. rotundata TaxID=55577 RepID=A0AB40ALU8_DIOCR|nr:cationic peroxidase 1-like [Dioscorea cayenensis subsp. rotundata]